VLDLGEANARLLVRRARTHLCNQRRRTVSIAEQQRCLDVLLAAAQTEDLAMLEAAARYEPAVAAITPQVVSELRFRRFLPW
jgi:hypothetical protein